MFSAEIYQYMLELLRLQEVIRDWEPDERKYRKWLRKLKADKLKQSV